MRRLALLATLFGLGLLVSCEDDSAYKEGASTFQNDTLDGAAGATGKLDAAVDAPTATGGAPGTGGAPATGGTKGTGGTPATGGTTGTGGTPGKGGTTGTGGTPATGGTTGKGGATGTGGAT